MLFSTEGIYKTYGERPTLKDISIHIDNGESVALLGVSGCGKTTLFNIISGLELPDSGKVFLNGNDITGVSGKIGYMQQKDLLLPFRTIAQNVSIPLVLRGENKNDAIAKARELLPKFGLIDCADKYPSQLSGGMRQRAALLRTYLFSHELLLLDEPFSALDAITRAAMQTWFRNVIDETGVPTLFITHNIDEAIALSDRIYIMAGIPGQIIDEFKVEIPKELRVDADELEFSTEFITYKRRILNAIK